jgi:hypothetical protein
MPFEGLCSELLKVPLLRSHFAATEWLRKFIKISSK